MKAAKAKKEAEKKAEPKIQEVTEEEAERIKKEEEQKKQQAEKNTKTEDKNDNQDEKNGEVGIKLFKTAIFKKNALYVSVNVWSNSIDLQLVMGSPFYLVI